MSTTIVCCFDSQAIGLSAAVVGFSYLGGGALSGMLVDLYQNYDVAFLVAGALAQVASLLFLCVRTEIAASTGYSGVSNSC